MPRKNNNFYDRLCRWYDTLAYRNEFPFIRDCCDTLNILHGENILEIGHGTGHGLVYLAGLLGKKPYVLGLDSSLAMSIRAKRHLQQSGRNEQVHLVLGSAESLPFPAEFFDVLVMTFTLELFPDDVLPLVLAECHRVLKPGGRLGIVSLYDRFPRALLARLYWRFHRSYPKIIDCRPIRPEDWLSNTGLIVDQSHQGDIWGLAINSMVIKKIFVDRI